MRTSHNGEVNDLCARRFFIAQCRTKARNADADPDELKALIDSTVREVRAANHAGR